MHRPTKNDTYAFLSAEAAKQELASIPEFRVQVRGFRPRIQRTTPSDQHDDSKAIDLVWARRRPGQEPYQNAEWQECWEIFATFEVEACDVKINAEFRRHLIELPQVRNAPGLREPKHFVLLYKQAFDRSRLNCENPSELVENRRRAAMESTNGIVQVFSVDEPELIKALQLSTPLLEC